MAREQRRNAVEWAAFSVGTTLTLAIVGFLAFEAIRGNGDVDLRPSLGASESTGAGVVVPLTLRNLGDAPALDVNVEVCEAGGTCRPLAFPHLPEGATREGSAVFAPGATGFTARVVSYQVP